MSATAGPLTPEQIARLLEVAAVLVPGSPPSPPALDLADYDDLLQHAAAALGPELGGLQRAVRAIPERVDWQSLRSWGSTSPEEFELVSTVIAGAYFMAPEALRSIGYATGPRRSAPIERAADELGGGLLDDVLARGQIWREVSDPTG